MSVRGIDEGTLERFAVERAEAASVEAGAVAVVDVRVEPGYTAATTAAMTRKNE